MIELPNTEFTFRVRPTPIAANSRIALRLSVIVLVLKHCRSNEASLVKLHVVCDALRSPARSARFQMAISSPSHFTRWVPRVDPELARAIDFGVGEQLISLKERAKYRLTERGLELARALLEDSSILQSEKAILAQDGRKITEAFIERIVSTGSINASPNQ